MGTNPIRLFSLFEVRPQTDFVLIGLYDAGSSSLKCLQKLAKFHLILQKFVIGFYMRLSSWKRKKELSQIKKTLFMVLNIFLLEFENDHVFMTVS